MSPEEKFLQRVDHKRTGPDTYSFRVPTRKDRHMSGKLRVLDDRRVLIHDFGGDSVEEILAAVGMTFADLYPERPQHHVKGERRPFPAADVLRAIGFEALVVATAGTALLSGHPFTDTDRERLILAVSRIQSALTAAGVRHG